MTYPRLRKEGTLEERRLLDAALDDCPSSAVKSRLLSTLGLGLGVATTVTASDAWASPTDDASHSPLTSIANAPNATLRPSSSTVSHPFSPFMQWIGLAGVVVGIGASTPLVVNQFGHAPPVQRESELSGNHTSASGLHNAELSTRVVTPQHEQQAISPAEPLNTAAKPRHLPPLKAPAAKTRPVSAQPETLNIEIRLVDAARKALQSGDASTCLSKLDERKRLVQSGILEPEVTLLGVQAKLALGQNDAAERDAQRFLNQHPEGPIADRIRHALSQANLLQ